MKDIKYLKTHRNSVPWSGLQSEWYGCTGELTKGISALSDVTAKKKNKSAIESISEEYKRLEKAHYNAQNKVESNKKCAFNIEIHKKEILYLTQEIENVKATHELMHKSALKMQKIARGYLARKGLENVRFP